MVKQKFMTTNQYAAYRQVSSSRVNFLCRKGVFENAARKVGGRWRIDVALADKILSQAIDTAWTHKLGGPDKPTVAELLEPVTRGKIKLLPFKQARAMRKYFEAKLTELEYLKQTGVLISAEDSWKEGFDQGRQARDALLNIPARVSPILAPITDADEIEKILRTEFIEAMSSLEGHKEFIGNEPSQKKV